MGWQDWVPVIGPASKGNWGGAAADLATGGLYTPIQGANKHFFEDPANEVKQAYDQASGQSDKDMKQLMDFYMGQQAKAQGFYKPIQSMYNTAYGTAGIDGPQTPQAPGMSLKSMYGGR